MKISLSHFIVLILLLGFLSIFDNPTKKRCRSTSFTDVKTGWNRTCQLKEESNTSHRSRLSSSITCLRIRQKSESSRLTILFLASGFSQPTRISGNRLFASIQTKIWGNNYFLQQFYWYFTVLTLLLIKIVYLLFTLAPHRQVVMSLRGSATSSQFPWANTLKMRFATGRLFCTAWTLHFLCRIMRFSSKGKSWRTRALWRLLEGNTA